MLEDLCGGAVGADYMRRIPEPEFIASICNLHHQLELQHQLFSNMKADFDQNGTISSAQCKNKWKRKDVSWLMFSVRSIVRPMLLITLLRSLRFVVGRLPVRLVWRTRSPRRAPRLVLNLKGDMFVVAEYKAWAFHARAGYETQSTGVRKKNSELLASIRGMPVQVMAACVPIELALRSDGIQKTGEVLDAFFGADCCEGLLLAVRELIHGRRGHKPMLQYSMRVGEVAGRIQLQRRVIDQCLSGCVLLENSDLSMDQKAMLLATTNRDVSFSSVQVALRNLFTDSQGSRALSFITDTHNGVGSPPGKGKDTNRKRGYTGGGGLGGRGDVQNYLFSLRQGQSRRC